MNIQLKDNQKIRVISPFDIFTIMRDILMLEEESDRRKEHFWTISLDHGQTILSIELVSLGTATKTLVEPMEVFSIPLQKKAVKIVLVHNHPSGILVPSPADEELTDRLIQVGLIMNVPVVDHLIISEESFYNFAGSGLLEKLSKSTLYVPNFVLKDRYQKQGKQKGAEQAVKQRNKEIVQQMRAKGYPVEEIMALTGLTKAVINRIKD